MPAVKQACERKSILIKVLKQILQDCERRSHLPASSSTTEDVGAVSDIVWVADEGYATIVATL